MLNLSMSIAESDHLIFVAECENCDMDKDTECGTGACGIWLAMDVMNYAQSTILEVIEDA